MLRLGCHLSNAKGYAAMGRDAVKIGANTCQFFTRNPRGGKAKALDENDIAAYLTFAREHHIGQLLAHAPYTMNACAANPALREFALEMMADDLQRLEFLPGSCYNFHPGSHVGQGAQEGVALIAAQLNAVLQPTQTTTVLLETMAGKGSEVGRSFEELRAILERVELSDKMGVCLDTCHIWDAGYDIVNNLDGVLEQFDHMIGLSRLRAIHLNDSQNPLGASKDRHAKIGEGQIGAQALVAVTQHPALKHLPFYLETPNELDGYAKEIAFLQAAHKA